MTWHYTYRLYMKLNTAGEVLSILSICLSVFILSSALYLRCRPNTRHVIDRVSFRLMLWSMIGEICYDAVYIGVGIDPAHIEGNTCGLVIYLTFATMGVVNWLCTCIAINLMMTIVFWVNPVEKGLEKWYIIGSVILGVGPPLVPAILGHFGTDPMFKTCYFTGTDQVTRRLHFILDVYLWQGLSAIVCAVCTITVLISLFRQSRRTAKALIAGNPLNAAVMSPSNLNKLNDRFYSVALRISWYPISLVLINGILTVSDLYWNETDGIKTIGQGVLSGIYTLLFGGRGVVLAMIGIFVDPCLRRGWQVARSKSQIPLTPVPTSQRPSEPPTQFVVSSNAIDSLPLPALWYGQSSYQSHPSHPSDASHAQSLDGHSLASSLGPISPSMIETPGNISVGRIRWQDSIDHEDHSDHNKLEYAECTKETEPGGDEVKKAEGYVSCPTEGQDHGDLEQGGGSGTTRPTMERLNTDEAERLYRNVEARL